MPNQANQMAREPSLGDLFTDLAEKTSDLVRQEAALAQAEIVTKATVAGRNVGFLAVGAMVGYAGALFVLAALVIGLSYLMPLWLSALLVGAALAAGSYFLIASALVSLREMEWSPTRSIESIKEDAKWLKKQVD